MPNRAELIRQLERERDTVFAQLAAQPLPEVEQMTYGSQAEAASDVFEQQKALSVRRLLEQQLRKLEDALTRAREGRHGLCESCGQEIPAERLQIIPEARLCIDCQRRRERRR